jgi:hypothetical protein
MQTAALSKVLTGLNPSTSHDYRMRAECPTGWSVWGDVDVFTTIQCDIPTNLSAINISSTVAQTTWDAVSSATGYEIRYRVKDSSDPFVEKNAGSNSKWVTGLTAATEYEYQVRTICSGESAYSALDFFTTLDACSVPTGQNVTNVSPTFVRTNWNVATGALSYTLRYRVTSPLGADVWKVAAGAAKWLTGLTPATAYSYEVRSTCATNNSAWSATEAFSTNAPKAGSGLVERNISLHLFPNPADEFIYVNYEMSSSDGAELTVFDVYGKMVLQRDLSASQGTVRLLTESWAAGHYLLKMQNGMEVITKRFVIL